MTDKNARRKFYRLLRRVVKSHSFFKTNFGVRTKVGIWPVCPLAAIYAVNHPDTVDVSSSRYIEYAAAYGIPQNIAFEIASAADGCEFPKRIKTTRDMILKITGVKS